MNVAVGYRGALVAMLVAVASACEATHLSPLTPDDVETGSFSGLGGSTVVFTGHVIRYVDSPDPEFRWYDLGVRRWLKGSASEGTFLSVEREVAGIQGGQPVMIIGEPVGRGVVIEAGA
ncbi:MAG: hypothetical protein H0U86_02285 [Chloroflexi bacterium]|nr:hypothetical protein [Chloroflexota bacterium]